MVGDNIKFESSFLSTRLQRKELEEVKAEECPVNLKSKIIGDHFIATIKRRSITNVK